jgi:tetratricopeptide (TPR) repeat protein
MSFNYSNGANASAEQGRGPLLKLSSAAALEAMAQGNDRVKWPDTRNKDMRLTGRAQVTSNPSFTIHPGDKVFTVGSCFARNVERRLREVGFDTPMAGVETQKVLAELGLDQSVLNKFNEATIRAELEWALEGTVPDEDLVLLPLPGGGRHDLFLNQRRRPMPLDQARRVRQMINDRFSRVAESRIFVITLGLAEAWFDNRSGWYVNQIPPLAALEAEPDRFSFHVMSYDQILGDLEAIHRVLTKHGHPDLRMLITVSPVPLRMTFRNDDVMTANSYSKSVLRTAAEAFTLAHENVDYFPSYEIVTLSDRSLAYEADNRHVQTPLVSTIVDDFIHEYMNGDSPRESVTSKQKVKVPASALALDVSPADADIASAKQHLRAGEFAAAAASFKKALDGYADQRCRLSKPQLMARYGYCLLQAGAREPGIEQTRLAAKEGGSDASVLLRCIDSFLIAGERPAAAQLIERLDKLEPGSPAAELRRGRIKMLEGDHASARASFERLLSAAGTDAASKQTAERWLSRLARKKTKKTPQHETASAT